MNLFGRKSAGRASARPALARAFSWNVSDIPRSYEAQVRAAMLDNPVAQRAVRMVSEAVGSAPLYGSDDTLTGLVQTTSAGQSLLESVAAQLLLHGNGYIQILCGPDGAPRELFALRPERVSVEGDARGWPVAYNYRTNEATTRLPADSVIHIKAMHPLDDHYGLGCLVAATGAVAIHNAATLWNKALLDNAARPSGALVHEASEALSADQFDRLQSELTASFSGGGNAGRPMLLEGGLRWQSLSLSPADMDFAGLKAAAAREIALAFGVPPVLLGLPGDATYSNYREANRTLWRQTVLPLAGKILGAVRQGLAGSFPGGVLEVDLDRVTELSEDRERLWVMVDGAGFLTLDEKREMVGLEALVVAAGDGADVVPGVAVDQPAPPPPNPADVGAPPEMKYNESHDPANGQFTFSGRGGSFGGGGASGSFEKVPARVRIANAKPLPKKPPVIFGGGSVGGGGASASYEPDVKPQAIPRRSSPPARRDRKPTQSQDHPASRLQANASNTVAVALVKRPSGAASTRRITSNGYHFDMDSSDQTRSASGTLRLNPAQRRSKPAQLAAGKPDRLSTDQGGHFIAREFNGPRDKFNHFAQDAHFNKSAYRSLELQWRGLIEKRHIVDVLIVPHYDGQSKRPSRLDLTYYVDGKLRFKSFPNKKGVK